MSNIEFKLLTNIVLEQRFNSSVLNSYKDINYNENVLLKLAYQNKVETALYNYHKKNPSLLSEKASSQLQKNVAISITKRTIIQKKLDEISKEFKRNKIIPLNIKGPASSIQLYNNPYTREYTDIDLVIKQDNFHKVIPIMNSLGYYEKNNLKTLHPSKTNQNKLVQSTTYNHLVFINPKTPMRIEIHDNFFQTDKYDNYYSTESVISRMTLISYENNVYYTPYLVDHALLLLIHGTKHAWLVLHWVLDMIAIFLIKNEELHTQICIGIKELKLEKHLALIISLLTDIYPITIPKPYLNIYNTEKINISKQLKLAKKRLENFNEKSYSIFETISFAYYFESMFLSNHKYKAVLKHFLISPTDANNIKLPKGFLWVHLVLRPFLVIYRRKQINKENNES